MNESNLFAILQRERLLIDKKLSISTLMSQLSNHDRHIYASFCGFIEAENIDIKCNCSGEKQLPFKTLYEILGDDLSLDKVSMIKYAVSMRYRLCSPEKSPRCLKCGLASGLIQRC